MTEQQSIRKMFDEKQKRQTKTEISIGFRWAVNCAINFLPEQLKGTDQGFGEVKKWIDYFVGLDREFMLDNMPQEDWTRDLPKGVIENQLDNEEAEKENFKSNNPDIPTI